MTSLEARYRRLLACYPHDHRTRHEEDMIGVLLAGSRPGQTRPHLADTADLLAGAVRMHCRRAFGTVSAPAWRDAVAVGMALWPLLILTDTLARQIMFLAPSIGVGLLHHWTQEPGSILFWARPVIVFALPVLAVALRRRGVAALGALAFLLYADTSLLTRPLALPNVALPLLAQVVAVAVAFTGPARRGASLIPWRTVMLWTPFGLVGLAASKLGGGLLGHEIALWKPVPWLIIMAAAAGYAARSVLGRRASLLLFLPVAALGDLGKLPSLPTPLALAQIGCVLGAFAMGTMLRDSKNPRKAGGGRRTHTPGCPR
ncbi:hypothetical protein AB0L53_55075 [Nonomuraea sp. NPDC052129]|uniref:hypothetical protein n=1 Tax=Nonomuraea sp. NPDC052129 TaxID=3154651 RepID=UPI00343C7684